MFQGNTCRPLRPGTDNQVLSVVSGDAQVLYLEERSGRWVRVRMADGIEGQCFKGIRAALFNHHIVGIYIIHRNSHIIQRCHCPEWSGQYPGDGTDAQVAAFQGKMPDSGGAKRPSLSGMIYIVGDRCWFMFSGSPNIGYKALTQTDAKLLHIVGQFAALAFLEKRPSLSGMIYIVGDRCWFM